LKCKETEPVLEVEKVMFLESGVPFEYSIVHHRFDMVEMSFINHLTNH
jgi:GntR family transcriptional regulator